jgi:YidC/Oxa1 family membrane protein insertase
LILIYGISMVVTSLLTPVSDPSNAKQSRLLGVGLSVFFGIVMFFWPVPSAFVLYWVFTNILATAQSLWAYRLPLPPLQKKNTPTGGIFSAQAASSTGPLTAGPRKTGVPQRHKPKKKKK